MMISHDIITFHVDDVYGQHIHPHPLTIHIKFATSHHYLQLCYNPLPNAMCQHYIYIYNVFEIHSGSLSFILNGVRSCHVAQYNFPCGMLNEF